MARLRLGMNVHVTSAWIGKVWVIEVNIIFAMCAEMRGRSCVLGLLFDTQRKLVYWISRQIDAWHPPKSHSRR